MPQTNHNNDIKDHWLQMTIAHIIIIMKKFGMLRELGNGTQETRSAQMLLDKWCQCPCLLPGCHSPSIGGKTKTKKQHLWSAIKWGMLVFELVDFNKTLEKLKIPCFSTLCIWGTCGFLPIKLIKRKKERLSQIVSSCAQGQKKKYRDRQAFKTWTMT